MVIVVCFEIPVIHYFFFCLVFRSCAFGFGFVPFVYPGRLLLSPFVHRSPRLSFTSASAVVGGRQSFRLFLLLGSGFFVFIGP